MKNKARSIILAVVISAVSMHWAAAQASSGSNVCNNGNIRASSNPFQSQCLGKPETVGASLQSASQTQPVLASVAATASPAVTITVPAAFSDFASPGTPGTRSAALTFTTFEGGSITWTFTGTCLGNTQSWSTTQSISCPPINPPVCSPVPDCSGGTNPDGSGSFGCYPDLVNCDCECSPIILDLEGHGFHLTSVPNGVLFDLRGDGVKKQMAWTAGGSGDAFLALDRNHNGVIDDGTELFGNFTPQPDSSHRNGFLALAEFDKPEHGGNGDGVIDSRDKVWESLLLWIDENHNGISEPNELHSLASMGIESIDLRYVEDRRHDAFGNAFKYRAKIHTAKGDDAGSWAYDVFLLIKP